MMRKLFAALVLAGFLAGPPAFAQNPLVWSSAAGATGAGLVLGPRNGSAVFSLACVRGTSEILAIAYGVKPQAGRQEFIVSIADESFVFVLKPEAMKDGKMVQAASKPRPELLEALKSGKPITAAYGSVRLGPYPAPPADLAGPLTARCEPLV